MRLGFLGTGRITAALVEGLLAGPEPQRPILLAPRNAAIAAGLAARFPGVAVAADNRALVEGSDLLVLALRPQDARSALAGLPFRAGQVVVSLVALLPLAEVARAVAPAGPVCRCLPLPTAAFREGPIVLFPDLPEARALLAPLGELLVAGSERELEDLWVPTALLAAFHRHLATVAGWCARRGVPAGRADAYTRALFAAVAAEAARARGTELAALAAAAQTPGGLNEQVLRDLEAAGVFAAVERAMDRIAARQAAARAGGGSGIGRAG